MPRRKHSRIILIGLGLFLIGVAAFASGYIKDAMDRAARAEAPATETEALYPAASTLFGDMKLTASEHAKVRLLVPAGWEQIPADKLTGRGRGVMALVPPAQAEADMPQMFVYNYAEFPIYGEDYASLYEEGMSVMEWAAAVAQSATFEDARLPEETAGGDAMFEAYAEGDPCVCVAAVRGAPMLIYYRIPYTWAAANARQMEFVKQDLADIAYSLEAL